MKSLGPLVGVQFYITTVHLCFVITTRRHVIFKQTQTRPTTISNNPFVVRSLLWTCSSLYAYWQYSANGFFTSRSLYVTTSNPSVYMLHLYKHQCQIVLLNKFINTTMFILFIVYNVYMGGRNVPWRPGRQIRRSKVLKRREKIKFSTYFH